MLYISPENEYPRHVGDIQIASPEWQLGMPLPNGWIEVLATPAPEHTSTQILEELPPQQVNGVWTQIWSVRDLTVDELASRNAPNSAREKLQALGFSDAEINALSRGLV